MALFGNLFKPAAPASPAIRPLQLAPVPASLPRITAPTAAQIAQSSSPSPGAQALLTPQQTPSQYLGALQQKHMGADMVNTLAHGLSDRDGVHWASQSAEKVADKLPPHEVHAMKAAQAWAKNPTAANQADAAAAAAKGGLKGPGSMAAQGAAWAKPATPGGPNPSTSSAAATPRLTPHAVTSAVMMSSAIKAHPAAAVAAMTAPAVKAPAVSAPQVNAPAVQAPQVKVPNVPPVVPPSVQAQTFEQQHPFIAIGIDIASGKTPV
jgi:hypothetical protein